MNDIPAKLKEREKSARPVVAGLVGAGQMGSEIVSQIGEMRGMEVGIVVDVSMERARAGFSHSKKSASIVETNDLEEAEKAIARGMSVASTDYRLACRLSGVEAVIDATGSTRMAATVAMDAIENKKHIIMMSVESDVTVGPILRSMAESAGVVYSLAAGDEPASIIELYRFADALGFEIVTAGKGKNNPLNIYSTPDTEAEKARKRGVNPRMLCEFVDGSKTAIEMAAVSNATGLLPDVRGMHGAKSSVAELNAVFIPKKDGGVLNSRGVVDFAIGVHPGVFVIITTDNDHIKAGLKDRDMGPGPYYTLYRPYHLCSVEVPLTVAQAVFYGESTGHPGKKLVTECIAVAKNDITPGEVLDGIGEFCYRGSVEGAETARKENLLPLGLAQGCRAIKAIPKDTAISYDMVEVDESSVLIDLRRIQDKRTIQNR
jgi:predicted homoserine dehydrogenase-like protein